MRVDYFANSPKSLNTIDINELKHLIYLTRSIDHLGDQGSQEFDQVWIVVVDAEIETIEERHWILLNIVTMLTNDLNDLHVQSFLLAWLLLGETISFFKSVGNLVMEINFLAELLKVLFFDLIIDSGSDFVLDTHDFEIMLDVINDTIIIEIIFFIEAFWIFEIIFHLIVIIINTIP